MKVVSAAEMRLLDQRALNDYGLDATSLMTEAGRAIALEIERSYRPSRICVVCGKGNNAGDGFIVARQFHELGRAVIVVVLADPESLTGAAKWAWEKLSNTGVTIVPLQKLSAVLAGSDVIVDAILGTGVQGPPRDEFASAILEINKAGRPVVSADIPSGLRPLDPGEDPGAIVRAEVTVTIGLAKAELLAYYAAEYVGRLEIAAINFPKDQLSSDDWRLNTAFPKEIGAWLPVRKPDTNKGTYGSVGIIAGSQSYVGATILVARAALRAGCGLAGIYTLPELNPIFKTALPEATSFLLESGTPGTWDDSSGDSFGREQGSQSVLAVGPGLGTGAGTKEFFQAILSLWRGPMVIDADGLNLLSDGLLEHVEGREDCLLTPHPGEMGRLIGSDAKAVQADRLGTVRDFATKRKLTVLLKGADTLVARPDGQVWMIPGAEPALAKGGTGDVLTGAIASLFAQGMPMWQAAVAAATAHLEAGKACAKQHGARGVLASDVADAIPLALDRF